MGMQETRSALNALAKLLSDYGFELDYEQGDTGCQSWLSSSDKCPGRENDPDFWVTVGTLTWDANGEPQTIPLTVKVQYEGFEPLLVVPLAAPDLLAQVTAVFESPYEPLPSVDADGAVA